MRQKRRRIIIFISLMLFPVTMNYLSPYVSVDGAFAGILSGSVLVFGLMFLTGLVFRRAWCAYVCPMAGLSELCLTINSKQAPVRPLRFIRYTIFGIWLAALIGGFVSAGGIRQIDPFHLTEQLVSVDLPIKFVTYYLVLFIFFGLTLWLGKRGACHAVCWMSPFLVGGAWLGEKLHLPQLLIRSNPAGCSNCHRCDQTCPMSLPVSQLVQTGVISASDCILCGECVDHCPKKILKFSLKP